MNIPENSSNLLLTETPEMIVPTAKRISITGIRLAIKIRPNRKPKTSMFIDKNPQAYETILLI